MKVLFVTNSLDHGGIETNLVLLSEALARRGHDVIVAARPGALSDRIRSAGARTVDLRSRILRPNALWRDARALKAVIRDEKPDVIHVFSATAAVQVASAFLRLGAKRRDTPHPFRVASVMGLVNAPDEAAWRTRFRTRLTLLGADTTLLISPAIEAEVRRGRTGRMRLVRQHVVGVREPSGPRTSPGGRSEARERLGLTAEDRLVLTVGGLAPRKSHHLFIETAALVVRRRPSTRFMIVGEGPLRPTLDRSIRARGLEGHVFLLGKLEETDLHYAAADLYMRPGVVEGFIGITVLEAQAYGLPVLAFETEDVRLAIKDGETGILVPPGDTAAMAEAMCRLLDAPDEARRIATAGRAHVRGTFLMDPIAERLVATYEGGSLAMGSERTPKDAARVTGDW